MALFDPAEQVAEEIAELPLFQGMTREDLLRSLAGGGMRQNKHREILYHAGSEAESFAVVLSGAYKLIRPTPRGDDLIVYFATPGDAIGALVMGKESPVFPVTAKAMGPSRCYVIPRSTFRNFWVSNVTLQQGLNSFLYSRMSLIQDEKSMARAPLQQRVAAILLQLLERSSGEAEQILPIPLTRQEIADSLGVAVESVIRIMSDWSQRGIIRTNDRHIVIQKPAEIIEILKES